MIYYYADAGSPKGEHSLTMATAIVLKQSYVNVESRVETLYQRRKPKLRYGMSNLLKREEALMKSARRNAWISYLESNRFNWFTTSVMPKEGEDRCKLYLVADNISMGVLILKIHHFGYIASVDRTLYGPIDPRWSKTEFDEHGVKSVIYPCVSGYWKQRKN